jgi:hypothetical protein
VTSLRPLILFGTITSVIASSFAGTLTVVAPPGRTIAQADAKLADGTPIKPNDVGKRATFTTPSTNASATVNATLSDGTDVRGIDLSWYSDEPADPDAGALSDDDRESIRAIVQDVPSFYNRGTVLHLAGDHARAVALVELVRDTDFHAAGGNVVWRVELYYFKFQYGGWEKVQQQNKVVRRERFKSVDEFKAQTGKLKWAPELGGIRVGGDERKRVTISETSASNSTTKPD